MANCTRCAGDAGLGHRICLQCLGDWSRMRFVAANYLKNRIQVPPFGAERETAGNYLKSEFKRLQARYKSNPQFFRDTVEWDTSEIPERVESRIVRAVAIAYPSKSSPGEQQKIREAVGQLKELWQTSLSDYEEQISVIELS